MIKLRLRHLCAAGLILYWPVVFLLSHAAQLPGWIISTQMSDKTMHFLGYLTLVFLWWFSIFPTRRPSLFQWPFWITLSVMAVYGGLDEWLQSFTHRTPDIRDWLADMFGVITGLVIFTVAGLRNSALVITAFIIFVLTSICKTDPLAFIPFADILFYVCTYGIVTLLWMDHLRQRDLSRFGFTVLSLVGPAILLALTSIVAFAMRKTFAADRVIAAGIGIAIFFMFYSLSLICMVSDRPK